jgi:hypothetical protein
MTETDENELPWWPPHPFAFSRTHTGDKKQ